MNDSKSKNTERSSLSNKSSCTEGVNPDQNGYEKAEVEAGHRAFEIERETRAELEECLKREKKESDNGEKKGKEKRDEKPCWPVISQGRCCCQETSSRAAENYSSWKLGSQEKERISTN